MVATILDLHSRLGNTAALYVTALAIWGLFNYFRRREVDGSYLGALAIAQVLMMVQAALGFYLLYLGFRPARMWIHILYGVLAIITLPAAYLITRGNTTYREALIYGLVGVFMIGVTLRAISTGVP